MSQNTDYFNSTSSPFSSSSSSSRHRNKRVSSHQTFLPTPSEYNTPSSMVNTYKNDSPSPPSLTSPIVSDVCMNSHNGVRNTSTVAKVKDNILPHSNYIQDKYSFTLNFSSSASNPRKDQGFPSKSRFYSTGMSSQHQEDLHSPFELGYVPICDQNPTIKVQNEFLIDRMLKDDQNSHYTTQYRSNDLSMFPNNMNNLSPLATPLSDHRDIDALSDAGTYIIEDDGDIAQDAETEQDYEPKEDTNDHSSVSTSSVTSPFRRSITKRRNRHGTFDIQGLVLNNSQSVTRPVVDINSPHNDLSSSTASSKSSSSSLLSVPTESDSSPRKEPDGASNHLVSHQQSPKEQLFHRPRPTTLLEQKRPITPPQTQIKPAECFVISPTFETKGFASNHGQTQRRKTDQPWKPKSVSTAVGVKDLSVEAVSKKTPSSPPTSVRSMNNESGRFSFRLQQQISNQEQKSQTQTLKVAPTNSDHNTTISKTSLRPHILVQDQMVASSPFQRHAAARQTMPAQIQHNRPSSASTSGSASKYIDEQDETLLGHPSLTKVYMNKSFALRRQRSNVVPAQTKPVQSHQAQQGQTSSISKTLISRQTLKPSVPINNNNPTLTSSLSNGSNGQTNRAVELRRARAQAKIEELASRTRHQLQKTEQHNDIMSASWHSNASSTGKRDHLNQKATTRMTSSTAATAAAAAHKQDMLRTRTITSAPHHRSSSASPNPAAESIPSARYRRTMVSSVTDEGQYNKMNESTLSECGRSESLRDDGQRLAIKLIQLSSGILAKLKPSGVPGDSDTNIHDLEQLVDKLQTVNQTLSTIDATLSTASNDEDYL